MLAIAVPLTQAGILSVFILLICLRSPGRDDPAPAEPETASEELSDLARDGLRMIRSLLGRRR